MKKLMTLSLISMSIFSASALSQDNVRLVVNSEAPDTPQKSAMVYQSSATQLSESCLDAPNGAGQWCLKQDTVMKLNRASSQSASAQVPKSSFEAVTLPSYGYSAQAVADMLNRDGRFGYVEVDPVVTTGPAVIANASGSGVTSQNVDDPAFEQYQMSYFESADNQPSGSNILGLWDAVGMEAVTTVSSPVDLIVMDSSFVENPETPYTAGGRNFSTTALEQGGPQQERGGNYQPPAELDGKNCGSHGLEVASIATAMMDNGKNMSGVTNNVNVHAIRTLTCGTGFLSDSADALDWLAGETFENVEPYTGDVGIVNMSFASQTMTCPQFMQDAVNRATEAGFTLVAAAGNAGEKASERAPANCENVISVGSLDRLGEKATFSNSDESIDIMTQGKRIAVVCGDSEYACYGQGTSYSTPLVAGVLATVKQQTKATDAVLKSALKLTARKDTLGASCDDGSCGAGLMDALGVYTIAQQAQDGELNRIEHALAGKTECEQVWYIDNFGSQARLCESFKLTFMGGHTDDEATYKLLSITKGGEWGVDTPTVEGTFDKGTAMLSSIDVESYDYGMQVCTDGQCGDVQPMNTEAATEAEKPVACQ